MKISEAIKPEGRFNRSQFAFFYFIPCLITLILVLPVLAFPPIIILPIMWSLFQEYMVIVSSLKRLRDLGKSAWYLLIIFVPLVNLIFLIYLLSASGIPEEKAT